MGMICTVARQGSGKSADHITALNLPYVLGYSFSVLNAVCCKLCSAAVLVSFVDKYLH